MRFANVKTWYLTLSLATGFITAACQFEAKHFGTPGRVGQTWSSYLDCPDRQCDTAEGALAAGGATSVMSVETIVPIARIRSSAADIFVVDESRKTPTFHSDYGDYFQVPVTSGVAGTATLQFEDEAGGLLDETVLRVESAVDVAFETSMSEPSVVVASTIAVSATPIGSEGKALYGHGSIQFSSDGVLERIHGRAGTLDAIVEDDYPDTGLFVAHAPAVGRAILSVVGATRTVLVHAVSPEEVDRQSIQSTHVATTVRGGWLLDYLAEAHGMRVYGCACAWTVLDPAIASVSVFPADLSREQSTVVAFDGVSPGRTTAVCTSREGERKLMVDIDVAPQ